MIIKLFYSLLVLFFSFQLKASWSPDFFQKIVPFDKSLQGAASGEFMTAWGGWRRMKLWNYHKGNELIVPTKLTKQGHVKTYLNQHTGSGPKPLMVFFPGIFGQYDEKITAEFISFLESFDVHVLMIPNFISKEWVVARPLYGEDPSKLEIALIDEIWNTAIKKIGISNISNVHVIAESLGNLLASAWVAKKDADPHLKSLTLLWPPLELDRAMNNLDNYVKGHKKYFEQCGSLKTLMPFLKYFVLSRPLTDLSKKDAKCLSAYGAYEGFRKDLLDLSSVHAEVAKIPDNPPSSFKAFFEHYRQEIWKHILKRDEKIHLSYWLKGIKKFNPQIELRVLTSQDDFLNKGIPLKQWQSDTGLNSDEMFILSWGGHSGPLSRPELRKILKEEFH